MKFDRYLLRGIIFSTASLVLVLYETLHHYPPRIELIIGYAVVFVYGVLTILTRQRRQEVSNSLAEEKNSE